MKCLGGLYMSALTSVSLRFLALLWANTGFSLKAWPTTGSLDKMCQCLSIHCLISFDTGVKVVAHTILLLDTLSDGGLGISSFFLSKFLALCRALLKMSVL